MARTKSSSYFNLLDLNVEFYSNLKKVYNSKIENIDIKNKRIMLAGLETIQTCLSFIRDGLIMS